MSSYYKASHFIYLFGWQNLHSWHFWLVCIAVFVYVSYFFSLFKEARPPLQEHHVPPGNKPNPLVRQPESTQTPSLLPPPAAFSLPHQSPIPLGPPNHGGSGGEWELLLCLCQKLEGQGVSVTLQVPDKSTLAVVITELLRAHNFSPFYTT